MQAFLVADDLTGALDSAVAFAAPGRRVVVLRCAGAPSHGADVVAICTGSREGAPEAAAEAVDRMCRPFEPARAGLVMKKVDSRLKGHVGPEVAALRRLLGEPPVVAIPAIPDMGRIQRGGRIEGSGIARPIAVAALFEGAVSVPDASSQAAIEAAVARHPGALWVGARGLAFALARTLGPLSAPSVPALPAPMVIAVGSRDPITLAQLEALAPGLPVIAAPDGRVPGAVPAAPVVVLRLTDGGGDRPPREAGADFARGIADLLHRRRPATLVATGGETADAILGALGVGALVVRAEFAPGLPVCEAAAPWGRLTLVTKSGGFGAPDVLAKLAAAGGAKEAGETTR